MAEALTTPFVMHGAREVLYQMEPESYRVHLREFIAQPQDGEASPPEATPGEAAP